MVLYAVMLAALLRVRAGGAVAIHPRAWWMVQAGATALAGAAVWFVGLQWIEVGAWCRWCLAEHGLGAAIAGVTFVGGGIRGGGRAVVVGVVIVAAGAVGQMLDREALHHLDAAGGTEAGELAVLFADAPTVGGDRAAQTIVMMLDYCCPHCQTTHGVVHEVMEAEPARYRLIVLPVPMNGDCNGYTDFEDARFEHACELARVALAVWRADPDAYDSFGRWLYASKGPRAPEAGAAEAARRVGEDRFASARADPWVDDMLKRGVDAWGALDVERVPVLLAAGMRPIIGRAASREALSEALDAALARSN